MNPDFQSALEAIEHIFVKARDHVAKTGLSSAPASTDQPAPDQQKSHGLAWLATYREVLAQTHAWALELETENRFGRLEECLVHVLFGEYLAQIAGGIPMSQTEIVRPRDLGLDKSDIAAFHTEPVERLMNAANTGLKAEYIELALAQQGVSLLGDSGLDATLEAMRREIHRYVEAEITPNAHTWHLENAYIPLAVIDALAELGIFGLTAPERYGGLGLGKVAMCVVTEELSRGFLGVGSLGTRTEIAVELILENGTPEQKGKWVSKLVSGECLPTAVFTEPNTGSDLAALRTRAVKNGGAYEVTGNKTWITHAARTDLMTLLARTDPDSDGYRGLSMFLAEKPRGADDDPFPASGMSGGEIDVIGYRGMKEYEIGFDGFKVPEEALLGGAEGLGFKQLMQTFESARIQTAARAIGVAQSALELGLTYATERAQFGQAIIRFPRVANKISALAAEILGVRQLTYFAARRKDAGARCDLEAGMAKLLAARIAWAGADAAVQIHGGNGFAMEFPVSRVLCDARILGIFEGANEIQAEVIARRILEGGN